MKYCVYRHIRLDTNCPFYVGKGCKYRATNLRERNVYHKNIVSKAGVRIEILKYFVNENDAFEFEKQMIKLYKSLGYCEANFSDGGEGSSGYKHTEKAKTKIAKFRKNFKVSNKTKRSISSAKLGSSQSEKTKLKMAISSGASEFDVFDKETNAFIGTWISQSKCARDLQLVPSNINAALNGKTKIS